MVRGLRVSVADTKIFTTLGFGLSAGVAMAAMTWGSQLW